MASAREISRLLRFPVASKIDTFAQGRVRLIKFQLTDTQGLDKVPLKDIPERIGCDVLVCAVERGGDVVIPDGDFTLKSGDVVTVLATPERASKFFGKLNLPTRPVHSALIVGGGTIGYYLAKELIDNNIRVRIVEQDETRCNQLAEALPEATILHGDGTDRQLLMAEGLPISEAVVALTNIDEENILISLFAKSHSDAKLITKINRLEFDDILENLDLGSVIYPKYLTCDFIVQYIRALQNESGSNIKTLYRILDDRVEALEFTVHGASAVTAAPLAQLKLKPNQLICCISRGDKIIIPRGGDQIQDGDSVIVVTLEHGLRDIKDILSN